MLGIDFPLFAFSHCRDVVAAVSRAGGFGVLGASTYTPEELDVELRWLDEKVQGAPYGVDILLPEKLDALSGDAQDAGTLLQGISTRHREFAAGILNRHGIAVSPDEVVRATMPNVSAAVSKQLVEVSLAHPIKLIANALGLAPDWMVTRAHAKGVAVAALVGSRHHAVRQVAAGVDIIVAQGGEAGGHCGEVSTLVLVPEILEALAGRLDAVHVLAAGGIMTGRQMAACMAMGAAGVWTGSVWLATSESETSEAFREKMVAATSRDTIRSTARTGKPARQLRSAWHDAWEGSDSPGALPMPLMSMMSRPTFERIDSEVQKGNQSALPLVSYFVGQGVGLVQEVTSARAVMNAFREDFADAAARLQSLVEG
jgi:NAD(P)H-dependent flavin oxidoreductase YrpB (nitropropane dioxygenase family)